MGEITRDEKPGAIMLNRLSTARISSAVGGLAILIAIFSFILQGDITPLVLICVLVGIGGLALWMALAPDDFRSTISGRRAVHGTNAVLVCILFAGVVAFVYTLSVAASVAVDLTSTGYYTLKRDIRPVVSGLTRPIQITAFYSRRLLGQQSADAPILRMFVDAAPDKVRLAYVDPDEQPIVAREFRLTDAFGLFVSYLTPEGRPDTRQNATVRVQGSIASEMFIAEAILQLNARGKFRIAFTVGSGEIDTLTDATGIRNGLIDKGIDVVTVDLANQDIPDGTTALIMLSPRRDYTQAMVSKIERYMASGGKLLLMANPAYEGSIRFMTAPDSPMATYLWDTWGIRPQRDIVFDPASYYISEYYVRPATYNANSPIVVKDSATAIAQPLFMLAQSWEINATPVTNVQVARLYVTSDRAFGKTNLAEIAQDPNRWKLETGDIPGPLVLAATAENSVNGARLIVVGDAGWVRDDAILSFDGQYLWTNMIDWLTQFIEEVTVNPVITQMPLNVSTNDLNVAALITLFILPGAVLAVGAVVWWRRARR